MNIFKKSMTVWAAVITGVSVPIMVFLGVDPEVQKQFLIGLAAVTAILMRRGIEKSNKSA